MPSPPILIKPGQKLLTLRKQLSKIYTEGNQGPNTTSTEAERQLNKFQVLGKKIVEKIKALNPLAPDPNRFNEVTTGPAELLNVITNAGLISEGQVYTGYDAVGVKGSITVTAGSSVEFIGQEVALEASAGVNASYLNYNFHVIQNLAKKNHLSWGYNYEDPASLTGKADYEIPSPIVLGKFSGVEKQFGAELGGKAGFEIGITSFGKTERQQNLINKVKNNFGSKYKENVVDLNSVQLTENQDTIEDGGASKAPAAPVIESINDTTGDGVDGETVADDFSLSLELSAEAKIAWSGSYIYLFDKQPSYYQTTQDVGLQYEFDANLGIASRREFIRTVIAWFKSTYSTELEAEKTQTIEADKKLTNVISLFNTSSAPLININYSTNNVIIGLNLIKSYELQSATPNEERIKTLNLFIFRMGLIVSTHFKAGQKLSYEDCITKLNNLEYQVDENWDNNWTIGTYTANASTQEILIAAAGSKINEKLFFRFSFNGTSENKALIISAFSQPDNWTDIAQVTLLPSPIFLGRYSSDKTKLGNPAFISYWGHAPESSAALAAKILTQGPMLNANAKIKFSKYRFQTSYDTGQQYYIFYTQDTKVTYKRIGLELKIPLKPGEAAINAIEYKSVITTWVPSTNLTSVLNSSGSGIAFGISISVKTIMKWDTLTDTDKLKTKIAEALGGITVSELNSFFRTLKESVQVNVTTPTGTEIRYNFGGQYIIIESSFCAQNMPVYFEKNPKVNVAEASNSPLGLTLKEEHVEDWLTEFKGYKLNDANNYDGMPPFIWNNEETHFAEAVSFVKRFLRARLRIADTNEAQGVTFKLSAELGAAGGELEIAKVSKVGMEGVTDIFTYDLLTGAQYDETANVSGAPFIAPVALFLQ